MPTKKLTVFILTLLLSIVLVKAQMNPISPTGNIPSARKGHTLVNINDTLYLFGGENNSTKALLNNLYKFIPGVNQWVNLNPTNPPSLREGHSAVTFNGKMYVFCGKGNSGELNDIWEYNPGTNSWQQMTPATNISQRTNQASVVLNGKIFVFGGRSNNGNVILGDLWSYDIANNQWVQEGNYPQYARYGHSICVTGPQHFTIFGGADATGLCPSDSSYTYNILFDSWSSMPYLGQLPPPSVFSTIVNVNKIWMIGGTGASGDLGGVWEFDLSYTSWIHKHSTTAFTGAAGTYYNSSSKSGNDNIIIFGGESSGVLSNQTYSYIPNDTLTVSQTSYNVSTSADSVKIKINSNIYWIITDNVSWLTTSVANDTVTIHYTENTNTNNRTAGIIISSDPNYYYGDSISVEVTINQAGTSTNIETVNTTNKQLSQNYPNPFTTATKINYNLPAGYNENVKIIIFNEKGQLINQLINKTQKSGNYTVEFNTDDLTNGIYYYKLITKDVEITKKMILLK